MESRPGFSGDATCLTILGLDSSIRGVMIADRSGSIIAHRLAADALKETAISDELPLAVPVLKLGIVVFLRIAGESKGGRIRSAVEDLLVLGPGSVNL